MSDVAVHAVDSDSFGKVESRGVDAIPAAERHGAPRELAFLWAGAFVNYASLFTASLLTTYYGLGVWDGLLATALGTLAAAVLLGVLSNTGPRSGQPQIVFTRRLLRRARPAAVSCDRLVRGGLRDRRASRRPALRRGQSLGDVWTRHPDRC